MGMETEIEALSNSDVAIWSCGILFIVIVIYIIVEKL